MDSMQLNVFLGVLSLEFWVAAWVICFWGELRNWWSLRFARMRPAGRAPVQPALW